MNSIEYDILYIKYKIIVFIFILLLSLIVLILILFCDVCTFNIALDFLILIISGCIILMILSTYYIIHLQMNLDFMTTLVHAYIEDDYSTDEYNNEL
jgi:hypothetical protein